MSLITGTTDYADISGADVIIEAIYENIDVKVGPLKMDASAKAGAILASNTSGLTSTRWPRLPTPEAVIGLHFFSQQTLMRLLEVVRGEQTSKEVIATSMKLGGPEQNRCIVSTRFYWQPHVGGLYATGR